MQTECDNKTASSQTKSTALEVQNLLLGEPESLSQFPGVQQYLDGLIQVEQLSANTICQIFGLDEATLKEKFKPITKHLLALFYYFHTGEILEKTQDYHKLNLIFKQENMQEIWGNNELSLEATLKLLVLLFEKLHNDTFFFKNTILRIPYVFNN